MIKCIDIKKQFDGFYALNGVNLHVEPGSVYGLVGPNGAGKSTLIRHLVGIYKQDEGQILIDGEPVYENNKIKSEIAYIPDDLFRFGADNIVDMMNFVKGFYPGFDDERFERLKSVFSIIDLKKPVRRMSKGMQKQAAFWLAISAMPLTSKYSWFAMWSSSRLVSIVFIASSREDSVFFTSVRLPIPIFLS